MDEVIIDLDNDNLESKTFSVGIKLAKGSRVVLL